jgi:hypothetical protein
MELTRKYSYSFTGIGPENDFESCERIKRKKI